MAVTKLSNSRLTSFNKYDSFLAGNSGYSPSDFDSIATTTVGSGGVSSVTFSSIPSTYTHLQLRITTLLSGVDDVIIRFNSDSANNYRGHYILGNGTAGSAGQTFGGAYSGLAILYAPYSGVPIPSNTDILDYANTNKFKTTRTLYGAENNSSGRIQLNSGVWRSTSAVTNILVIPASGATFSQYSSFALYGIR
jgi:hypothetical protein